MVPPCVVTQSVVTHGSFLALAETFNPSLSLIVFIYHSQQLVVSLYSKCQGIVQIIVKRREGESEETELLMKCGLYKN